MSSPPHASDHARRQRRVLLISFGLMALLIVLGIVTRLHAEVGLRQRTEAAAVLTVATVQPKTGPATETLVLPGTAQAQAEAPVYARTEGYLQRYLVDIGSRVKKNQLLAQIDTPEIDQQLHQAEADLAAAEANYVLAQSSALRWRELLASESVSKQEAEERESDALAKKAMATAARANRDRLRELQSFQRVVAPFDGVITARNTDVGALIGGGGRELFRIAAAHKLRVYVHAPQNYAPFIKPGLEAQLYFAERPQRSYPGRLVRSADAIDPHSRTLLLQIEVDNAKGELLSGSFVQVHLQLPARDLLRVPVNTLIFRADGLQVATVVQDRIALKPVEIGRDLGMELEVIRGLGARDQVVLNPPDSIANGQLVRIVQPETVQSDKVQSAAGAAKK